MKIDIYDFDKTIYNGDSSIDFFLFCLKRNKSIIINIPKITFYYILYFLKIKDKTKVKEVFFSFLKKINTDDYVLKFWESNKNKIKSFYLDKDNHTKDIIISASPEFLLKPICDELGVHDLIASQVDEKNGKFPKSNCKGIEKVNRLKELYKNIEVDKVYTDSYSDKPLIDISKHAYIVNGNNIKKIK